jgi:hypothetical protein
LQQQQQQQQQQHGHRLLVPAGPVSLPASCCACVAFAQLGPTAHMTTLQQQQVRSYAVVQWHGLW